MTFEEIVDQTLAMLQRRGRVAYRTLKRQFTLDDEALEDLKAELIKAQRLAVDENGEVLVWAGGTTSPGVPAEEQTRAERGYSQVVAVVGEPGVGKSRLVYEYIHSHHMRAWRVLESASISYGKASPYFPVIDLLQRFLGIDANDDPRTIRAKVTGHVLMLDEALQETIPPLLALLNALPEDHPFSQVDPPLRRQQTLSALKRVLRGRPWDATAQAPLDRTDGGEPLLLGGKRPHAH